MNETGSIMVNHLKNKEVWLVGKGPSLDSYDWSKAGPYRICINETAFVVPEPWGAIAIDYTVLEKYKENKFFKAIYLNDFNKYKINSKVTNSKKLFSITEIEGILFAYKIFYVGCSRARRNLMVVCDNNKVESFKDVFEKKLKSVGFIIETLT